MNYKRYIYHKIIIPYFRCEYEYNFSKQQHLELVLCCLLSLSKKIQQILSSNFLVTHSKYAVSLLLVQIPILYLLSDTLFNFVYSATQWCMLSFWIMFLICAALSHVVAMLVYSLFESPSEKLANVINHKLSK